MKELKDHMVQITVLKVQIESEKSKKKILRSVSGLQGVDKIEIDVAKGTVTVTGDADPYEIILRTQKAGKFVEVVTVGPPPAPPKKPDEKKPEEKKPAEKKPEEKKPEEKKPKEAVQIHPYNVHMPHESHDHCYVCRQMTMERMDRWEGHDQDSTCAIM